MEKFIKEIEELEQKRIDYMLSHKTTKRSLVTYVEKFEIQGNIIKLYYKLKRGEKFITVANELTASYRHFESEKFENFCGINLDVTGKYLIISFWLRSNEDIQPYIEVIENSIPKQKVKDKIEELERELYFYAGREHAEWQDGEFDGERCDDISLQIKTLKELLEEKYKI